jgi:ribosomal protein S16
MNPNYRIEVLYSENRRQGRQFGKTYNHWRRAVLKLGPDNANSYFFNGTKGGLEEVHEIIKEERLQKGIKYD